jgi:PAS domain S-box-containing protein
MKILIVDDKIENTYLLQSLLAGIGYETCSATNGSEALKLALTDRPDFIISDILMPVMDGFAFCRECKKNESLKEIPFVFYTATYTSYKDEKFALSLGADKFILKPQDPDVFVDIIRNVLSDFKRRKTRPNPDPVMPEEIVLKEYNSVLVRKLEDKMAQVEKSEKKLKEINAELQKEIEDHNLAEKRIALLAHSIKSVSECISITDEKDNIVFVNDAFLKTYGFSELELIGKNISILRPEGKPKIAYINDILLATKEGGWKGELINKKKDGTEFPVYLSTSIIKNDDNEPVALIGVATDITETNKARDELILAKEQAEKSDKLKTEFLAQISHEIRTPMNVITSFVRMIKDEIPKGNLDDLTTYADLIEISAHRIIRTIELTLNMSEMQIGTYQPFWKNIDLTGEILTGLLKEFSLKAQSKNLRLNFSCRMTDTTIKGDQYSLTQIFSNLLENAIKYTEKGKIDLTVAPAENNGIKVTVEDTGIGISEEFMDKLFEPFIQEERGYSRRYEGNGLGLALVKKYCDLNSIDIKAESKKGEGSRFTLMFNHLID